MLRSVARLRRIAAATSVRRLWMSTTSAASIATSVPAPMAIPTSARVSAGASLMPSPTIATFPASASWRMTCSLPSGFTPAMTRSTPASRPTACAVRSLSPVSITTRMPIPCSSRTAWGLSALMASATAITPRSLPSRAKNRGVLPDSASCSACLRTPSFTWARWLMNSMLPPVMAAPSTAADRPLPGTARKSTASGRLRSPAYARTARASGCSLFFSSAAARVSSSSLVTPSAGSTSVTTGSPLVMVPVLSSATICTRPAISSEAAVLNSTPCFAPMPLPTMMATGVARPSAQGQLITSTEMARPSAWPTSGSISIQTTKVMTAMEITAGTKMPLTRSATLAMGAFVAAASDTMRMIWLSVVSSPTRVASHLRKPLALTVAADTASPTALSTGMLSPVSAASLTEESPSSTTPSTGMLSPGRTRNISPFFTCAMGTIFSSPATRTVAVWGASFIRERSASVVFPWLRASSFWPTVIRVRIIAADS